MLTPDQIRAVFNVAVAFKNEGHEYLNDIETKCGAWGVMASLAKLEHPNFAFKDAYQAAGYVPSNVFNSLYDFLGESILDVNIDEVLYKIKKYASAECIWLQ